MDELFKQLSQALATKYSDDLSASLWDWVSLTRKDGRWVAMSPRTRSVVGGDGVGDTPEDALAALATKHALMWDGQKLHVMFSDPHNRIQVKIDSNDIVTVTHIDDVSGAVKATDSCEAIGVWRASGLNLGVHNQDPQTVVAAIVDGFFTFADSGYGRFMPDGESFFVDGYTNPVTASRPVRAVPMVSGVAQQVGSLILRQGYGAVIDSVVPAPEFYKDLGIQKTPPVYSPSAGEMVVSRFDHDGLTYFWDEDNCRYECGDEEKWIPLDPGAEISGVWFPEPVEQADSGIGFG